MAETVESNPKKPSDSVRIVLFVNPTLKEFFVVKERDDPDPKLPGGNLEEGEVPQEGMLREFTEELGSELDTKSIVHAGDLANQDGISVRHIYAGILAGKMVPGSDIDKIKSVSLDSIPDGKHQAHIRSAAELALATLSKNP